MSSDNQHFKKIMFSENTDEPLTRYDKLQLWWWEHEPRFIRRVKNVIACLKLKFFIKSHIIETGLNPWYWHDTDSRMLNGMMHLVVEFVEEEKGFETCDWSSPDDARVKDEVMTVYTWWKGYPARCEEISKLRHEWYQAKYGSEDDLDDHWTKMNKLDTPEIVTKLDSLTTAEEKLLSEEEDMLIKLVKVRGYLWT